MICVVVSDFFPNWSVYSIFTLNVGFVVHICVDFTVNDISWSACSSPISRLARIPLPAIETVVF